MARLRSQSDILTLGAGKVVAATAAPANAPVGTRWFNTATAVTYQRTANADGTLFWLDITSSGIGTSVGRGVDFVGDIDPHKATNLGVVGSVYYNREKNRHFVCTTATSNSQVWSGRYAGVGGAVTEYLLSGTYYRVHTFLNSGTFSMEDTTTIDYLVIAGGGGGGGAAGGGGGAGGYRTSLSGQASGGGGSAESSPSLTSGTYQITVGVGGSGTVNRGENGGNSSIVSASITDIISIGGGAGGRGANGSAIVPTAGGSGGGGGKNASQTGGGRTANQGFVGGNTGASSTGGAGGGGAGALAANSTGGETPTPGGAGVASNILDGSTAVTRAGGGGGGQNSNSSAGVGGAGGGGNGSVSASAIGTAGTVNTGGGGGGGGWSANYTGGNGGSGLVIIRYALS